jgi:hypothetical protein
MHFDASRSDVLSQSAAAMRGQQQKPVAKRCLIVSVVALPRSIRTLGFGWSER